MVLSVIGINCTSEWLLIAQGKAIRPFTSAIVTLFGCPPCLGRSAYSIELHWIIKLISEKRVITCIGTYGQTGKCLLQKQVRAVYKNR